MSLSNTGYDMFYMSQGSACTKSILIYKRLIKEELYEFEREVI
jgi:hypothetical protein